VLVLQKNGVDVRCASHLVCCGMPAWESGNLPELQRRAAINLDRLEPFVDRVTMTIPVLASAPEVVFIVTGADKADAAERAFGRPPDTATPASLVRSNAGTTRVVADRAAAAKLLD